jgi:hypothetical protein
MPKGIRVRTEMTLCTIATGMSKINWNLVNYTTHPDAICGVDIPVESIIARLTKDPF